MRTTPIRWVVMLGNGFTEVFRNIPLLVQMFLWFFVVPELLPTAMGDWVKQLPNASFWTAVVALAFFTAARVAEQLGLAEHHTIHVNLAAWGGSALTDSRIAVPSDGVQRDVIPSTYVPGRNTVFIAIGLSLAEARGAERLVLGVNAVDYSGYPDCRPDYLAAFQQLADLASKAGRAGHARQLW